MIGLVLSILAVVPRFIIQAYQLFILIQAEILVFFQPAQWIVGPVLKRNRAHTVLTILLPSSSLASPRLQGESPVQTVVRLLKGLDWEAASEAAAKQHQLTARGMAISFGHKQLTQSRAARRRWRRGERGWWGSEPLNPVAGFRVTHAYVVRSKGGHERGVVKAMYLTRHLKWVDAVDLQLLPTAGECQVDLSARPG